MKKIAVILLTVGLLIIGYATMQLVATKLSEKKAVAEAKKLLENVDWIHNHSKLETANTTSVKLDSALQEDTSFPELSFQQGQTIGILQIPGINKELPIVEGTEEEALKRGVGHYTGTVYPGQNDQILLSGHRDTVFTGLDKLQNGDMIIIKMLHGTFTYTIIDTEIVDENDTTVIRSTAPEELLTLSTCYPFRFIGNATKRYIVYAKRNV